MQVIVNGKDRLTMIAEEIERHLHSGASWFGAAAAPSGELHVADRIASGVVAFQIDAGNNDWGAWVQILGSTDTPTRSNMLYFDPHQILINATEGAYTYFIQFGRGDSGAAALSAGTYTELVIGSDSNKFKTITDIQTGRAPAGSKIWARCLAVGQNTATLDFYMGIHEYSQ